MEKKENFWQNELDRMAAIEALKNNEIVLASTDTILGFLGNCTRESYDKIVQIKQAPPRRPFLILVSSFEKVGNFVDLDELSQTTTAFVKRCWPGPVTFVFKAKPDLPPYLASELGTIALRCPDHAGLQAILPEFDGLFSTSANKTDEPPLQTISEIPANIVEQVSLAILDKNEPGGDHITASTIVDLRHKGKILREGAFPQEKLEAIYEEVKRGA